jgi:large subunit ribosomal protein L22
MKAFLKNYRQSPRKVRLVAGLIRGKSVDEALVQLRFLAKRAGEPIEKLLLSAVSNAKNMGVEKENLFIKEISVDKGIVMKRMMPAAMGTGHRINKRTSHVQIVLAEKSLNTKKPARNASHSDAGGEKTKIKKETTKETAKVIKPKKVITKKAK